MLSQTEIAKMKECRYFGSDIGTKEDGLWLAGLCATVRGVEFKLAEPTQRQVYRVSNLGHWPTKSSDEKIFDKALQDVSEALGFGGNVYKYSTACAKPDDIKRRWKEFLKKMEG